MWGDKDHGLSKALELAIPPTIAEPDDLAKKIGEEPFLTFGDRKFKDVGSYRFCVNNSVVTSTTPYNTSISYWSKATPYSVWGILLKSAGLAF